MSLLCILEEVPFSVGLLKSSYDQKDNFYSVWLGQQGQTKIVHSWALIPDLFEITNTRSFDFVSPSHSS